MGRLASLRSSLEGTLEDAWENREGDRSSLSQDISGIADDIADCIEESESNPAQCIEDEIENNNVDDAFETTWDTSLSELRGELRSVVADEWGSSERGVVRELAQSANLDRLNTLCMRGQYDEVEERLNLDQDQVQDQLEGLGAPASIDNTASNCLAIVNHLSGFADNLASEWEEGS